MISRRVIKRDGIIYPCVYRYLWKIYTFIVRSGLIFSFSFTSKINLQCLEKKVEQSIYNLKTNEY